MRRYRVKYSRWADWFSQPPYEVEYTGLIWPFGGWCGLAGTFPTIDEAKECIRKEKEIFAFNKKRNKEMEDIYYKP